ncbi:MAG: hypothetical protein Q8L55_05865 [Phycisphaerales bacterium]|nr:hypothetical protein [Phycisphaerales bacterium]
MPPTAESKAILDRLPDSPTVRQLRALFNDSDGIGLFAPARIGPDDAEEGSISAQWSYGSILLLPTAEWEAKKAEFVDWQFEGVEAAFADLPYGLDDILCFAAINFSPDMWYIVLRGPMAGAVCWWTHDGDSVMHEPWATDLRAWGERIWREVPEVFGGVIRPTPDSCIDPVGAEGDLYPERYVADMDDTPAA